ncbi:TetR family transcriptional regulator [Plantibacter sp. VKM Ac-2885]|uniref:TetR/AcrR family transcriptional regulator n=1 Tax=Plantibacter sp. VKM Ac-2885 TaxID=2783828 RepID=UPI00188BF574|nr:TetR family transcriptional regulator [Plantibacter sp. VKM Ac-2885]
MIAAGGPQRTRTNVRRTAPDAHSHPRYSRTGAALSTAAIELASETPASRLTVDQVVRRAGVNRSTFYTHSENPTALLNAAMRTALDRSHTFQLTLPGGQRTLGTTLSTVSSHVQEHLAVYRTALADPTAAGAIFHNLSEYLEEQLTRAGPPAIRSELAAAAIAGAVTGTIRSGLRHGEIDLQSVWAALNAVLRADGESQERCTSVS